MLSDKIKELRIKSGLSQLELSSRLFCSRSLVSKWEQGKASPSNEDLKRIATILGADFSSLKIEPIPSDILCFSFTMKSFLATVGLSVSYVFWPYFFLLILVLFGFAGLGIGFGIGISEDFHNYELYFILSLVGIFVLGILLFFLFNKAIWKTQGGVGLAYSSHEWETVSIDPIGNEMTVDITSDLRKNSHITTSLKILFVKEKSGYWILGESRFRSAILPKKYLTARVREYLEGLSIHYDARGKTSC